MLQELRNLWVKHILTSFTYLFSSFNEQSLVTLPKDCGLREKSLCLIKIFMF